MGSRSEVVNGARQACPSVGNGQSEAVARNRGWVVGVGWFGSLFCCGRKKRGKSMKWFTQSLIRQVAGAPMSPGEQAAVKQLRRHMVRLHAPNGPRPAELRDHPSHTTATGKVFPLKVAQEAGKPQKGFYCDDPNVFFDSLRKMKRFLERYALLLQGIEAAPVNPTLAGVGGAVPVVAAQKQRAMELACRWWVVHLEKTYPDLVVFTHAELVAAGVLHHLYE